MKRDMDLIRKLLLYFEQKTDMELEYNTKIPGYDETTINYHLVLLAQAELIDYECARSPDNSSRLTIVKAVGLTWQGQEFLDTARNETIWKKTKSKISEVSGGLSLELLKSLLLFQAKQKLGID